MGFMDVESTIHEIVNLLSDSKTGVFSISGVYFQGKRLHFFQVPRMTAAAVVAGTIRCLRFSSFLTFSTRGRLTPSLSSIIISRFFSPSYSRSPPSTLQFPMIRHRSSAATCLGWTPPLRGPCLLEVYDFTCEESDESKQHWLIMMDTSGLEFETEQALFKFYIKTLASVVGSEEEAKKKIYFVSCGFSFGFGAEIDEDTSHELSGKPGVIYVFEDDTHEYRKGVLGDRAAARFAPINWNHRIDDAFSYHHLSEFNSAWNSDHWLVHIQSLDGEFSTRQQVVDFCIRMLAEVVGSEDDAIKKIYSVWCKIPFGFGAEIDEETLNRLKALPDVLLVLPDFAFDVKHEDDVLIISPSSHLKSDSSYYNYQPSQVLSHEDYEESLVEPLGESDQSLACFTPMNHHQRLDNVFSHHHLSERNSKWNSDHWLIVIKQREGGYPTEAQTLDFLIKILAEAIGSEQEAKEKIYIIWSSFLLGFGAEIDEETSNKLKGYPNVLKVLPDYAFDVKDSFTGALLISHSQISRFNYYTKISLKNINATHWDNSEEQL